MALRFKERRYKTDGLLGTSVDQLMGKEGFRKVNENGRQVLESRVSSDVFLRKIH